MRTFMRAIATLAALGILAYGLLMGDEWPESRWLLCLGSAGILFAIAWWPSASRRMPIFNRTVIRWATLIAIVSLLISVQLVRVQIVESTRIAERVEITANGDVIQNPRRSISENAAGRGAILDANGNILAETVVLDDGSVFRRYPEPSVAGLVGYFSPDLYGSSQIEAAFDDYLSGSKGGNPAVEWLDGVLHRDRSGYDIELTVNLEIQRLASSLLNDQPGAVVLMDANTGELLALGSSPMFDPNRLNVVDGKLDSTQQYWQGLLESDAAPLLFRPLQGLYTPGSIFKTVTASAVLDSGLATPETAYRDEGAFEVDGRVIVELNRPEPSRASWTLEEAYAYSLNVVFAQVGLQLTGDVLLHYAHRFGFDEEIPLEIPTSVSQVVSSDDAFQSRTLIADTAFGQGELLVTPLQMAMVVSAIVNDGDMLEPLIARRALDDSGDVVQRFKNDVWKRPITSETASAMREMMIESVEHGYASGAQIDGVVVGGKTGTAETGSGAPHAWFIGFVDDGEHRYVVSVVVEHGGSGGEVALPIGREMLLASIRSSDE